MLPTFYISRYSRMNFYYTLRNEEEPRRTAGLKEEAGGDGFPGERSSRDRDPSRAAVIFPSM